MWILLTLLACEKPPCQGSACLDQASQTEGVAALTLLDVGCQDGDAASCGEAARVREFGLGVPIDNAGALAGYQDLCTSGVARGCMAVGNMLRKGTAPGGADPVQARVLIERACALGDGLGCASLAHLEANEGNFVAAREAAQRGCSLGEPAGCGLVQEFDANPPLALDRAQLQSACDQGETPACVDLGLSYSQGIGGPADLQAALSTYERACASEPLACFNLAHLHEEGRGSPRDLLKAEGLYLQACGAGVMAACVQVGNLEWTRGEVAKAMGHQELACKGGIPLGCSNLALDLLSPPEGMPADPTRGMALLEQACQDGEPFGCANLGRMLLTGVFIAKDEARGLALLEAACQQGVEAACAR